MLDTGINQHIQVITVDGDTDITAPQDNVYYYDPNFKTGITLYVTTTRNNFYSGDAVDIVSQIVEAEMGDIYAVEALKAQAVAAYTYYLNKKEANVAEEFNITDDYTTDQAFITVSAAREKWGNGADEYENKIRIKIEKNKVEN